MPELFGRMEFAADLAKAAGAVALRHFQTELVIEEKADRSPVTIADRECERLIRERISAAYPDDGIFGEELGETPGKSGWRWVVDPIDGTKSFVQGVPLFGVLIGLERAEGPEVGAVYLPALSELVCGARGEGSWWNGRRARVSSVDRLADACLSYTSVKTFEEAGPDRLAAWTRLCDASRLQRGWGDCYGHVLVATGRAEVMLDPILSPWDCAALLPILEEAGGTFTDWRGGRTIHGGSGISTNGKLFAPLFRILEEGFRSGTPADGKGGRREAP